MAYIKARTGFLAALVVWGTGTTDGVLALPGRPVKVKPQVVEVKTPELLEADRRVKQSKEDLDLARKQLEAARALLKAAEAEYKAAQADREALALRTRAQNLADASGFSRRNAKAQAQSPTGQPPAASLPSQPVPAGQNLSAPPNTRIQQLDFNAEPLQPEPIPLR
ncbi:MAG TPA: hypothetical protein V6D08_06085 [Candidatus Obscuribacterales bacterium]